MDITIYTNKIQEFAEKYREWVEPLPGLAKNNLKENNIKWSTAKWSEIWEKIESEMREKDDLPGEIEAFLNENYYVYYSASPEETQRVREAISDNRKFTDFLLSYAREIANKINKVEDDILLKRALVAISIENSRVDFRDTWITLADLYVSAEEVEIDSGEIFKEIAEVSSQESPRGGTIPLSEVMMNFEEYAVVRERRSKKKNFWQ